MMKRLPPIAAAALLLTACGAPESTPAPESTSVTTSASSTSSTTSTTSSAAPTTSAEPTLTIEPTPGQPSPDSEYPAQSTMIQHGANAERINVFEDTAGQFWLCDKQYPNGSPETDFYANPNGCAGPYGSMNAAQEGLARAMHDALAEEFDIDSNFDDYDTLDSPYPDTSENAVFNSCWENGYAQFTDGSVRPYADCELAPVEQTPSPWVQGQIDWVDCLDAGNSEEYCRETLN